MSAFLHAQSCITYACKQRESNFVQVCSRSPTIKGVETLCCEQRRWTPPVWRRRRAGGFISTPLKVMLTHGDKYCTMHCTTTFWASSHIISSIVWKALPVYVPILPLYNYVAHSTRLIYCIKYIIIRFPTAVNSVGQVASLMQLTKETGISALAMNLMICIFDTSAQYFHNCISITYGSIADTDMLELASSQWMLKTIFYRLMLTFASFVIGSTAEYEQSVSNKKIHGDPSTWVLCLGPDVWHQNYLRPSKQ